MKFQLVLVFSISPILVFGEEWSKESRCVSLSDTVDGAALEDTNCTVTARWQTTIDGACTVSEYSKQTITTSNSTSSSSQNGVPQCTMTPCESTEKIQTDCETAFGARLNEIR